MSGPVNVYTQGTGTTSIAQPISVAVAPSATTLNYPIGQILVVTPTGTAYILVSKTTVAGVVTANWDVLTTESGNLESLTTQDSTVVLPVAGNINISGTSGQFTTTGSGNTVTIHYTSPTTTPGALTVIGLLTGDASATINTAGTALNLATDNDTAQVNIGTGTSGRTIDIGTSAAANLVAIGSNTGASSLTLHAGSGNFLLAPANAATITLGTATMTGTMTLGNSTGGQTVNLNTGASGNVTPSVTNVMTNSNAAAGNQFNVMTGACTGTGTDTVNILTGNNTTSAALAVNVLTNNSTTSPGTVSIATGTSAPHVVNIGTNSGAASTTVLAGTGGMVLSTTGNVSINNATFKPSGVYTNAAQYAGRAYLSSTQANVTGNGASYSVVFDQVSQQGTGYATGTGIFTVPADGAGWYLFSTTVALGAITTGNGALLEIMQNLNEIQGAAINPTAAVPATGLTRLPLVATAIVQCAAADAISIVMTGYGQGANSMSVVGNASAALLITSFSWCKLA